MVVKVPVYFEVDFKEPPKDVEFILDQAQRGLTDFLKAKAGGDILEQKVAFGTFRFKIITRQQVINRIGKSPMSKEKK